jgi:hypothetical protein
VATLYSFQDGKRRGFSCVRMDNGHRVHIWVSRTRVRVRKSRVRFLGAKLYESNTPDDAATFAETLHVLCGDELTPPGMNNPVLKAFTKAVLRCSTVAEVIDVLAAATDRLEPDYAVAAS